MKSMTIKMLLQDFKQLEYLSAKVWKVITQFQLNQIFSKAWMTMKNVVTGF